MLVQEALKAFEMYMHQQDKSPNTISGYMLDLNFLRKWLEKEWNGPVYLEDVTIEDVEAFLQHLKDERNYKPMSRKRVSGATKMFFKFLWKKDMHHTDIASKIESVKCHMEEREYLSEEEALHFIKAIRHPVVQVYTYTLFYTGLRLSEALALTVEDVDLETGWIHVRNGKGNKSRKIPISGKLRIILENYLEWKVESPNFFATDRSGDLSKARVNSMIRETRDKLKCKKKITPHVFRHSFASQLVKKDVNIVSISKLLGHSNLKTTSIYTHTSSEQLVDAIDTL